MRICLTASVFIFGVFANQLYVVSKYAKYERSLDNFVNQCVAHVVYGGVPV